MIDKAQRHIRKAIAAIQETAQAITNPGPYVDESEIVIDRPNYMLTGHKSPHVYGYPDQDRGVRIAEEKIRRVQRNHGLHYDAREYKPMTMESMFRRL